MISPRWTPIRKHIRRSAGFPLKAASSSSWITRAAAVAALARSKTASTESPAMSMTRPWNVSIWRRNTARAASSVSTVARSSAAMRRAYPAASAARIAARRCRKPVLLTPLFDNRRIGERAQLATQRIRRRQAHLHDLRHEHHDHLLAGIDPERRPGRTAPRELARRAGDLRACLRLHDREAETEADAGIRRLGEHSGQRQVRQVLALREVIHRHELDRLAPEQSNAVELALVQHHRGEPEVVVGRRHQAAATGEEGAVAVDALGRIVDELQLVVRQPLIVRGKAFGLF